MKSIHRGLTLAAMVGVLSLSTSLSAASKNRGLFGNWEMMLDFDSWQMPSMLSFTRDGQGELTGEWISLYGISELKDIKREGREITFGLITLLGDDELRSRFKGRLNQGQLSGQLSSDRGEISTEGKKIKRMPGISGAWNMTFTIGEREINTVLVVSTNEQGKLQAQWQSEWGEHEISDVQFKKGKLTFNRLIKFEDRRIESTFEGTLKGRKLTGMIKSELGDVAAVGKQVGGPLIGKWDLTMTSDQGTRKQRLVVNPDLSGTFAGSKIGKINWEEGQVGFDMTLESNDRDYEIDFKGRLARGTLTGHLTTSWGTSEVVGKKIRRRAKKTSQTENSDALSQTVANQTFKLLFDGLSLENFKGARSDEIPAGSWLVQDGQLICTPRQSRPEGARGSIVTKEQYADFDLRFEYKLDTDFKGNVNSGIKYFAYPGTELGLEYQLYDHDKEVKGSHAVADLYDLLPAKAGHAKPRGQWNKVRIVAHGKQVEHWLNDEKVLDFERGSEQFRAAVAQSKFKNRDRFGEAERGHILLQDHGGGIAFRNIMIKVSDG